MGFRSGTKYRKRLFLSGFGWSQEEVERKWNALLQFRPDFIHCYPSLLSRLLRAVLAYRLPLSISVTGVLAGSEACEVEDERLFLDVLGARTVSWYGQSEQVVLAVKENSVAFACFPGYSQVGFKKRENGLYEICGRSKLNPNFSVDWYRTGDLCESFSIGDSDYFGCVTLIIHGLHGRSAKKVIGKSGSAYPLNQIIFGLHSESWAIIDRYTCIQRIAGVLSFLLILRDGVSTQDERLHDLVTKLDERVEADVITEFIILPYGALPEPAKWQYFFPDQIAFELFFGMELDAILSKCIARQTI